jgi:hypothetical protein
MVYPSQLTGNFLLDFPPSHRADNAKLAISMLQQAKLGWIRKTLRILYPLAALLPAFWVLSHPMPASWLRPLCKDTWPILLVSAMAAALPSLFRRHKGSAWSLVVIALTQAIFQAWCYNTGSHPALSPFQMWGMFPATDSHMYYSAACELLNGQQISAMAGARHPYPLLLALLLKIFGHDFWLVTVVCTILMSLATWSAFEVIRLRLGGLAATVFLTCATLYIRIHCTGLFMTEQLAFLYSLCAVGLLVESITAQGQTKTWLYCGGLFLLTQALNARPAAYMILPFLVLASWKTFEGGIKARGKVVVLGAIAVTTSLFFHTITYQWVVASPAPSNAWFCVYGVLNGGTWLDGRKRAEERLLETRNLAPSDQPQAAEQIYAQALGMLKQECLAEISRHPGRLLSGWWRAVRYLWSKNTPFRSAYPQMPSVWFTESARWCAVLGLALSLFFLVRGRHLDPKLKTYQTLSWLNLAALLGLIASIPFAPPWDGETRVYAATLPLFFLLPASGVGGLCLLIATKVHKARLEFKTDFHPKIAIGTAVTIGSLLSIMVISTWWCVVAHDSTPKDRRHPVRLMLNELTMKGSSVSSFDLRSLKAGYHLHVVDDKQATWLPDISRRDFIRNVPRGTYTALSPTFEQLPIDAEIVVLPYWVLLALDKEDAHTQTFTPMPEQTGHVVWPPVYFSKLLHVEAR